MCECLGTRVSVSVCMYVCISICMYGYFLSSSAKATVERQIGLDIRINTRRSTRCKSLSTRLLKGSASRQLASVSPSSTDRAESAESLPRERRTESAEAPCLLLRCFLTKIHYLIRRYFCEICPALVDSRAYPFPSSFHD